jgi:hypothetical protein
MKKKKQSTNQGDAAFRTKWKDQREGLVYTEKVPPQVPTVVCMQMRDTSTQLDCYLNLTLGDTESLILFVSRSWWLKTLDQKLKAKQAQVY